MKSGRFRSFHCANGWLRGIVFVACASGALHLSGCASEVPASPSGESPTKLERRIGTPAGYEEEIQAAIAPCWSIDPETPPIAVTLDVSVRRDGTVLGATVIDQDRYGTDPSFRDAADRARRAVLNPHCQPLPFPDELWPTWREVTLRFHPGPGPAGP